jgi:DNA-binding response OmpR family regulator
MFCDGAQENDGLTKGGPDMSRKKILIVEDDPDLLLGLQYRLGANDYEVIPAGNGMVGIAQMRKHKPDLMLLDLGLPAGDGFSVLERIKINEGLASMPVIVFSGRDRVGNQDRALKAGAISFLQKPVENDTLLAAIRLVLKEEHYTSPAVQVPPGEVPA